MSEVVTATAFGLATVSFWGCGVWLLSRSSKKNFDSWQVNFAVQVPGVILTGILVLFSGFSDLTLDQFSKILLIATLYTVAFVAYIKAFAVGKVGVVAPLTNLFPFILLLLTIVFRGLPFEIGQLLALIVIVCGAILVPYEKSASTRFFDHLTLDKKLALLVAVLWGGTNFILEDIVAEVPWQTLYFTIDTLMLIMAALLLILYRRETISQVGKSLTNTTALKAGLIISIGSIGFFMGGNVVGSIILIAIITSIEPLIASIFSRIFDHEILDIYKRIGAILVVSGIILLNIA